MDSLDAVIPGASDLLRHVDASQTPRTKIQVENAPAPDYVSLAPARPLFWESGNNGQVLSPMGCFPLTAEPSKEHFDVIVETQEHLRDLGMLHTVEGLDEQRMLTSLRLLIEHTQCHVLVHELINGLVSRQVRVYKGLDTGFRVPDADINFWAVSKARDNNCVDVFVSLKAPNDVAVLLHAWLAHHEIPRHRRFEMELQLEAANSLDDGSGVAMSVQEAIRRATYAEVLSTMQRLRMSDDKDQTTETIGQFCHSTLIKGSTQDAWRHQFSKASLDGSLSTRDLLNLRLDHHMEQGAKQLPTLDSLVQLHEQTQKAFEDAIFFGERRIIKALTNALMAAFDPWQSWTKCDHVDINADLFALIYFNVIRRLAFEDVYLETTDRCPLFLSQPDQAAVFSELWVLGSQCEVYFDLSPRDVGDAVSRRYQGFLREHPPPADYRRGNEIMTMYPSSDSKPPGDTKGATPSGTSTASLSAHEKIRLWRKRFAEAGAMSIFCLPAIIDVVLLTFVGRGCFMTAFMEQSHLEAAGYALLASMLLTAGVTGWVGSTGNYYIAHYAYDSMVYFHLQRLSGGFVLTLVVAVCGLIAFSIQKSVAAGFIWVAYLICISTYFNLLGVMSTMHQHDCPLTSGRHVVLQTFPMLFIAPIVSSFVNGYDLEIYIPVMYAFLLVTLIRYRLLCHEWSNWMENIPTLSEKDIIDWYSAKLDADSEGSIKSGDSVDSKQSKVAQETFNEAVTCYTRHTKSNDSFGAMSDPIVARVAKGMPYIDWLLKKLSVDGSSMDRFSTAWFTQLTDAIHQQRQLRRGLTEHSTFTLFRLARYDIGQNLGLFLIALMDRWIMVVMSARQPYPSIYTDSRARYGLCFGIVYFCLSAILLDSTLQKYWGLRYQVSEERLNDIEDAKRVIKEAERTRRTSILTALTDIFGKLFVAFGCTAVLLWLFVESMETTIIYYMYVFGYSCAIVFQFNRCFTTDVGTHITIIMFSAAIGFIVGCVLHALPMTAGFLYTDVLAQNVAGLLAAVGTSICAWRDSTIDSDPSQNKTDGNGVFTQNKITVEDSSNINLSKSDVFHKLDCPRTSFGDSSAMSDRITDILRMSLQEPGSDGHHIDWSPTLLQSVQDMWVQKKLVIQMSHSEDFSRNGLEAFTSFSYIDADILCVGFGGMGKAEHQLPAWQPMLAIMACEALYHHVARSLNLSYAQAVQAEHFVNGTSSLCKRIKLELTIQDPQVLTRLAQRTEMKLMQHLCLGLDVNSKWDNTPQAVREAIVHRIAGKESAMSNEISQWATETGVDVQCTDFHVKLTLQIYQECNDNLCRAVQFHTPDHRHKAESIAEMRPVRITHLRETNMFYATYRWVVRSSTELVKWIAIISGAGSNIERELSYCLDGVFLKGFLLWFILLLWKGCWLMKNFWVYWIIIHNKPALVNITRLAQKGERRKISGSRIVVELPRRTMTGFALRNEDKTMELNVFDGTLKQQPIDKGPSFSATYDDKCRLIVRVDNQGSRTSTYQYEKDASSKPFSKRVTDVNYESIGYYDKYGRIIRGIASIEGREFAFQYHYRATPKGDANILRADFKLADSNQDDCLSVFWGKPLDTEDYTWVPSPKIHRIIRKISGRNYITDFDFQHRRDPAVTTYVDDRDGNKTALAKHPEVFAEEEHLLEKPKNLSFASDDLLRYHSTLQVKQMRHDSGSAPTLIASLDPRAWLSQWSRRRYRPVSTWYIRTELWNHWLKSHTLDAVTACWVDELTLREEPLLRKYWRARDSGRLEDARKALDENIHQIVSAIDIETDVSEVSVLPIKTSDLYAMGLGKDANPVTARPQDCFNDTENRISVMFNDIGCWPIAPGGVSNCRRDLVNGHSTIRNHVLSECANDYGIPRFQIEKNVQSLKLLPLWGLEGNTANHGVIDNLLQTQVDEKIADTDIRTDIVETFIPLLVSFVKGARTKKYSRANLVEFSNVVLSMAKYYETKDYTRTWKSQEVHQAWSKAWLTPYKDPNIADPSEYFDIERPSMSDFRDSLNIYMAYFFIFAVQVPEECPRVFQSTHHGISSLFGMILKYRRGVTFGIWDHAILWRECCLNISPAQSELPLAVQSMLLAGIGMATRIAYFQADVIMPCASVFNP